MKKNESKLDCRRCENWVDKSVDRIYEANQRGEVSEPVFCGCKIYGVLEVFQRDHCPHYEEASELFGFCARCGVAVPRVCLSLGECVNCTDTNLYCVENCHGEGEKKFCSHYQRLVCEGHTLIENNSCFEIYPTQETSSKEETDSESVSLPIARFSRS